MAVFDAVWHAIDDNYYDVSALGPKWREARRLWRPRAAQAVEEADLYLGVLMPMLTQINASHVQLRPASSLVLPTGRSLPLPRPRRGEGPALLGTRDETGMGAKFSWDGTRFVVADVHRAGEAASAGLKVGDVVALRRFKRRLDGGELSLLDQRTSKNIEMAWRAGPEQTSTAYELFDDKAAYVRFENFDAPSIDWFLRKLSKPHSSIVLDLRANRGGLISEVHRLLSALLPAGTLIGRFQSRQKLMPMKSALGLQASVGRIIVMIDFRTVSGGEIVADTLRRQRSAVLVGHRTAGAVLASKRYRLPDGGTLMLPYADYLSSSGERLEGFGVLPDVAGGQLDHDGLTELAKSLALKR